MAASVIPMFRRSLYDEGNGYHQSSGEEAGKCAGQAALGIGKAFFGRGGERGQIIVKILAGHKKRWPVGPGALIPPKHIRHAFPRPAQRFSIPPGAIIPPGPGPKDRSHGAGSKGKIYPVLIQPGCQRADDQSQGQTQHGLSEGKQPPALMIPHAICSHRGTPLFPAQSRKQNGRDKLLSTAGSYCPPPAKDDR